MIGRMDDPSRHDRSADDAAAPPPAQPPSGGLRLGLKSVLTLLVLATVLGTATVVHLPWFFTARASVNDTVSALNAQIVERTTNRLNNNLADAEAALAALRTILFQRVLAMSDVARREFLFLAYLQSHPSMSWVSFGWPNGDFFGAHKVEDDYIQMVESTWNAADSVARRRIDHYTVGDGDIWFQRREFHDVPFFAPREPWYQAAMSDVAGEWSEVHSLPVDGAPGISLATRLTFADGFVGVISVSIALERLAEFLRTLSIGESGTVFIVDRHERLIAARDQVGSAVVTEEGMAPRLPEFSRSAQAYADVAAAAMTAQGLRLADITEGHRFVQTRPGTDTDYFVTFAPLGYFDWVVVTVVPASDFLAGIEDNQRHLAWLLGGFIAATLLLAMLLARLAVARPLADIVRRMGRIEEFDLGADAPLRTRIRELEQMAEALDRMARGLAAFRRYLPATLVRTLISQGIETHPQSRTATILFTDIEGFTGIGERMSPEDLVALLNEYFTVVTPAIDRHGGVITQIQGDAILAVYNVPTDDPEHATAAVRSALEIQALLGAHRFTGGKPLRARVGINTGAVVAGSVGSPERVNYTVHGDAVNVAARLEALNKDYGTRILVSQSTVDRLQRGEFRLRAIGEAPIRGKQQSIAVYEVMAPSVEA